MEWLISVKISIYLALLTATFCVGMALLGVYFLKLFFEKSTKFWLIFVHIPRALPPTVLGFYFMILFGKDSFLGEFFSWFGVSLLFNFQGILLASILFNFSFAFSPILLQLQHEPKAWFETYLLMDLPLQKYIKLSLRAHFATILTTFFSVFSQTLGEFGLVMMVGGSLPNETKVASIEIFEAVETLNYTEAHQISAVLVAISLTSFGLIFLLKNRKN